MAYGNNPSFISQIATGAIAANIIVCKDTNDGQVVAGTANRGRIVGVSPVYSTLAGSTIAVQNGGIAQLVLGSGGCTAGDYLKSDASGAGVVMGTGGATPQHIIGKAERTGSSGDVIPVLINIQDVSAGADYLS